MATVNISAMAKTWNDAGTTFTAIGLDVTDTASNAASRFIDFEIGSSSVYQVLKSGSFANFNAYTDDSNYERGIIQWDSNVFEITSEAVGTGTQRQMKWGYGNRSFETGAVAGLDAVIFNSNYIRVEQIAGNAARIFWINTNDGVRLASGLGLTWSNSATNAALTEDTGLIRNAAGVIKATDGSTGIGEIIFKVPTSDPGITGALWNNAGTLSISA